MPITEYYDNPRVYTHPEYWPPQTDNSQSAITRQAFNRAFLSYSHRHLELCKEVICQIQFGAFDWRYDLWARTLAANYACVLSGVNELRRANRRAPLLRILEEEAIKKGATDTFPVRFRLATGEEYKQDEGIPMEYLDEYLWQLANNPKCPVSGDRSLARHDWEILRKASRPYTKLHPLSSDSAYTHEDRVRYEAFLISGDPLRRFDTDSNLQNAKYFIEKRTELRFVS